MTLSANVWEQVRQRAGCACEYCGITEIDVGGLLTVDHYQPSAKNGTDDVTNLIYCCFRCNTYKGDYWPATSSDCILWNPRHEPADKHMLLIADGSLHPVTPTGSFSVAILRLNRAPLVSHRLRLMQQEHDSRSFDQLEARLRILEAIQNQQAETMREYLLLLEDHKTRLQLLLRKLE